METAMSWREEALQEGLQKGLEQAQSWREEALEEGFGRASSKAVSKAFRRDSGRESCT